MGKVGAMWLSEDEDDFEEYTVLPTSLHPGLELKPIDVVIYQIKEKTPPRYGIGRFITTLEKYHIARPSTIATVVPGLESKTYVKIINNIVNTHFKHGARVMA